MKRYLKEPLFPVGEGGALLSLVLQLCPREVVAAVVCLDLLHDPRGHHHLDVFAHRNVAHLPLAGLLLDHALAPLSGLKSESDHERTFVITLICKHC